MWIIKGGFFQLFVLKINHAAMKISFSGNNQFSTRTLYEIIKQRENRKRKSGAH